jgi:hypothetical protein
VVANGSEAPDYAAAAQAGDLRPRPDPSTLTTAQLREGLSNLRELIESRLNAMDTATQLLAETVKSIPALAEDQRQHELTGLRDQIDARFSAMDKATELLAASVGRVPSDTDKQVSALRELLGARIDGMDVATKLLAENVRQVPTDIDKASIALREILTGEIRSVQDVANEKFLAIDGTFASNALALTAALAAQKEAAAEQNKSNTLAITKSEQATKETISANAAQTATGISALASNVQDVKERVVRIESTGAGTRAAVVENRAAGTFDQADRIAQAVQDSTRQQQARMMANTLIAAVSALVAIIAVVFAIAHK